MIVVVVGATPHLGATAPAAWLTQDGTPTAMTTLTLVPDADTQVSEDNPDFTYGTKTELLVNGGADPEVASYLRFDVSGVSAPVQRATLRLWVRDKGGTRDGPALYATDTDWTETALTWTTRPAAIGSVLDDTETLASSTWVDYDVTAAVRGDGPIAFVLVAQSADGVIFHSREGEHPPQLVVLAGTEPPTPTPQPNVTPAAGSDPTLLAAGDIADCDSEGDEATANLLDGLAGTIAALGDNAYDAGTAEEFAECYDPTWGRHKRRTRPAIGNHEYLTSGAAGYFGYFGAAAGDPTKGYYSYDLGSWHIVVLNSNCSQVGGCDAGSPQETWLRRISTPIPPPAPWPTGTIPASASANTTTTRRRGCCGRRSMTTAPRSSWSAMTTTTSGGRRKHRAVPETMRGVSASSSSAPAARMTTR